MTETLQSLRELRHVLVRLAVRQASRYWNNLLSVFASNLFGGAVAGAVASIVAAVLLGVDAHRGQNSITYQALRTVQRVVVIIEVQIQRELQR